MQTTPYANSLFEQPWWLDLVAPKQWEELFVRDIDDEIIARMPIVKDSKHIWMPRLTQTMGIWMRDELYQDYGAQKKVILDLFGQCSQLRSVQIRLSPRNQYVLPLRWLGYALEPCFTYRLSNLQDSDAIYRNFNKTVKKNIKYAKNKVVISTQANTETLWRLLDKTFSAQKRKNPMSYELIAKIVAFCEENACGRYIEARDPAGNVHSCAYFVYDEQICYYLLGASDSAYRSSGAQSLVIWEGIQFAAKHTQTFDFEGSMVEGIENFFRQFGGVCTPYYEIRKTSFLREVSLLTKPYIKRLLGYKM